MKSPCKIQFYLIIDNFSIDESSKNLSSQCPAQAVSEGPANDDDQDESNAYRKDARRCGGKARPFVEPVELLYIPVKLMLCLNQSIQLLSQILHVHVILPLALLCKLTELLEIQFDEIDNRDGMKGEACKSNVESVVKEQGVDDEDGMENGVDGEAQIVVRVEPWQEERKHEVQLLENEHGDERVAAKDEHRRRVDDGDEFVNSLSISHCLLHHCHCLHVLLAIERLNFCNKLLVCACIQNDDNRLGHCLEENSEIHRAFDLIDASVCNVHAVQSADEGKDVEEQKRKSVAINFPCRREGIEARVEGEPFNGVVYG
jgi:hypothetical protein